MELCATAHHTGCVPNIEHTKRTENTWADALTNNNFTGYDPNKRLDPDEGHTTWQVLDTILHLHATMEQGSHSNPPPSSPRKKAAKVPNRTSTSTTAATGAVTKVEPRGAECFPHEGMRTQIAQGDPMGTMRAKTHGQDLRIRTG